MKYQELRSKLGGHVVFSLSDIRKIDPRFYRVQLDDWQTAGSIKKLRRGHYYFSDTLLDESTLSLIANRLYAPSYVSLESALSRYGLIPEGVYSITSASTRKTAVFSTPIGEFSYHTVSPALFFGYQLESSHAQQYKIAEIEKAVLDYLYLNPTIAQEEDFHEWRFNSAEFIARADRAKLLRYAKAFRRRGFGQKLEHLLGLIDRTK